MTYAMGDCEIEAFEKSEHGQIVADVKLPEFEKAPIFERYGVAIDVGTTTLVAGLYDRNGILLGQASRLNPQREWGADVVSRIEASMGGSAQELERSIRRAIDCMITELSDAASINSKDIESVVITGNTVMLSLLTKESAEPFSHAPFDVKRLFGETMTARELDLLCLREDAPVYLPPCISAFVGADITCAIIATELCDKDDPSMLVDIGTNGEMALWHGGKLTVCSTAAGPAFEGVGISMGMRGSDGAIDKVWLSENELSVHVIGDKAPKGICGSGIVDAIACMLESDVLDETGYLEGDRFEISGDVSVTDKDIRMLQLAKSAVCAGLLTLCKEENINPSQVAMLYIAGGFGNYLNRENAARIGLLPRALAEGSVTVGNAALAGASMLLLCKDLWLRAEEIAKSAKVLELSAHPSFTEYFISGMMLEER